MRSLFFYSSNSSGKLFEFLINQLKNTQPFEKVWVVCPSLAVKNELTLKIAESLGICMHIDFLSTQPCMERLVADSFKDMFLEPQVSLALKIQSFIEDQIDTDLLQPVKNYLTQSETGKGAEREKLISLSDHLASQFITYALYVPNLKEQFKEKNSDHWQFYIWQSVLFETDFYYDPTQILKAELKSSSFRQKIVFYNVNFLPSLYLQILEKAAPRYEISFAQLSACSLFWSDIQNSYERKKWIGQLRKKSANRDQIEELNKYLLDTNPLLASLGKLGKEWNRQIEDGNFESNEDYEIFNWAMGEKVYDQHLNQGSFNVLKRPPSLLGAIQTDFLLLRTAEQRLTLVRDESVAIHQASTVQREVEILYENLKVQLITNPLLKPKDIVVYVSDLEKYIPYIESIFSPSSEIQSQIYNYSFTLNNRALRALWLLVELSQSFFEQDVLIEFFSQKAFLQANNLNLQVIQKWTSWIEELGPCRSYDQKEQRSYFSSKYEQDPSHPQKMYLTWQDFLNTLIKTLCLPKEESFQLKTVMEIDFSQCDEINTFIEVIQELKKDLEVWIGCQQSLLDWSNAFIAIYEKYYRFEEGERKNAEQIISKIIAFGRKYSSEREVDFSTFYYYLKKQLSDSELKSHSSLIDSVSFYSLQNCNPQSSKVCCILGLNDQSFPRISPEHPLSLLKNFKSETYCPKISDYDRYLFLEMLLKTKEKLIISYLGYCSETFKQMQPSILVTELLSYIDEFYACKNDEQSLVQVYKHPHFSFDQSYFQQSNYRNKDFLLAKRNYQSSVLNKSCLRQYFEVPLPDKNENLCNTVKIEKLISLCKDPLKYYFESKQQVKLDTFDLSHEHQNFYMDSLQKSLLQRKLLTTQASFLQEELPKGVFKGLSQDELLKFKSRLKTFFDSHKINQEDVFKVELRRDVQKAHLYNKNIWIFPSLELKHEGRSFFFEGKIDFVTSLGVVSFQAQHFENLFVDLPKILILHLVTQKASMDWATNFLSVKAGQIKPCLFEDAEKLLGQYLNFYLHASRIATPFLPQWIPLFMEQNPRHIKEKLQSDLNSEHFYSLYAEKIFQEFHFDEELVSGWKEKGIELFKPIVEVLKK